MKHLMTVKAAAFAALTFASQAQAHDGVHAHAHPHGAFQALLDNGAALGGLSVAALCFGLYFYLRNKA